jgi:cytochrome d ubiquinol oxidase subunit I
MMLDPELLARIQFAFTISFHIIFPAISIGLASFLAVVEGIWLSTRNTLFIDIYKFWVKIFAVSFGLGVVSGVVMSYQFGTNWSTFSDSISNVLGPLLGFEVLTAFFLEASFLGIMLFGSGRVSEKMHFFATSIVAIGTLVSAFWILSANSWMQTPQGFTIGVDGRFYPEDWIDIIFNPSFPYRLAHMVTAAYLATAFLVGGVASFYLIKSKDVKHAKIMLTMSIIMACTAGPAQMIIGHEHGINTMKYQPAKVAAMEANWKHERNAPLILFGIPNKDERKVDYSLSIPNGASWILTGKTDGKIPKLNDFPSHHIPPITIVFWSFRIMVGIGIAMIGLGIISAIQYIRKKIFTDKLILYGWILMIPSGLIAILAGWFVTEIGRQPWSVYNVMLTVKSISPAISGNQVALSLLSFVIMYSFVFSCGIYYICKIVSKGISGANNLDEYYKHSIESSFVESIK